MFFYASVLSSANPVPAIVLDAEDTDVYVIASKVSHEILAPLLIHRKGKYYDCSRLCPDEIRQYITQVYIISGCDTVGGFYGHGKKTIVKKAIPSPILCSKLRQLGKEVPFNENKFSEIEEFVLKCIYNETNITCSNLARAKSWNKMKKKNTARLNRANAYKLPNFRIRKLQ